MSRWLKIFRSWLYSLITPPEVTEMLDAVLAIHRPPDQSVKRAVKQVAEIMELSREGWEKIEAEMEGLETPFGDVVVAAKRLNDLFRSSRVIVGPEVGYIGIERPHMSAWESANRFEEWKSLNPDADIKAHNRLIAIRRPGCSFSRVVWESDNAYESAPNSAREEASRINSEVWAVTA